MISEPEVPLNSALLVDIGDLAEEELRAAIGGRGVRHGEGDAEVGTVVANESGLCGRGWAGSGLREAKKGAHVGSVVIVDDRREGIAQQCGFSPPEQGLQRGVQAVEAVRHAGHEGHADHCEIEDATEWFR